MRWSAPCEMKLLSDDIREMCVFMSVHDLVDLKLLSAL